jgi:multimeric flavodoxin WrbA
VLEGASSSGAECEKIILSELKITPISEEEYEKVNAEGFSPVDDDMQLIYRKIKEADAVIFSSPIFFGSLSSQAKIMVDRFQCVWIAKNIMNIDLYTESKKGAFLCAEATKREDFFDNAKSIVKNFFATVNAHYEGELFCPGLDKKGSVQEHPEYLEKAYELGKSMVAGNG